jgi:DNA-binding MarR family transcriptional regulator
MDGFGVLLEDALTNIQQNMQHLERQVLAQNAQVPLSVSELHVLVCLGKFQNERCTMSALARALGITPSSATTAVTKLVKKGYIQRSKSKKDVRIVYVGLTPEGKRMDMCYRVCRQKMIDEINQWFTPAERPYVTSVLQKLNQYFKMESMNTKK